MKSFVSLLAASLLVACSGGLRSPQPTDSYDFGPPPTRLTDGAAGPGSHSRSGCRIGSMR
jgi:hypothetical protein